MTLGDIWGTQIFFSFLQSFWPTKNANLGHWTPPNDFSGHLGPTIIFWPTQKKMLIWVIGHLQMTFGGIWDKQLKKKMGAVFGPQKMQMLVIGHLQMTSPSNRAEPESAHSFVSSRRLTCSSISSYIILALRVCASISSYIILALRVCARQYEGNGLNDCLQTQNQCCSLAPVMPLPQRIQGLNDCLQTQNQGCSLARVTTDFSFPNSLIFP